MSTVVSQNSGLPCFSDYFSDGFAKDFLKFLRAEHSAVIEIACDIDAWAGVSGGLEDAPRVFGETLRPLAKTVLVFDAFVHFNNLRNCFRHALSSGSTEAKGKGSDLEKASFIKEAVLSVATGAGAACFLSELGVCVPRRFI